MRGQGMGRDGRGRSASLASYFLRMHARGKRVERVLLDYGSGGKASHRLIGELFLKYLGNEVLDRLDDAAFLEIKGPISVSTDTFTVDPIFFPAATSGPWPYMARSMTWPCSAHVPVT